MPNGEEFLGGPTAGRSFLGLSGPEWLAIAATALAPIRVGPASMIRQGGGFRPGLPLIPLADIAMQRQQRRELGDLGRQIGGASPYAQQIQALLGQGQVSEAMRLFELGRQEQELGQRREAVGRIGGVLAGGLPSYPDISVPGRLPEPERAETEIGPPTGPGLLGPGPIQISPSQPESWTLPLLLQELGRRGMADPRTVELAMETRLPLTAGEDVVAVGPEQALVSRRTGRPIYQAPPRPQRPVVVPEGGAAMDPRTGAILLERAKKIDPKASSHFETDAQGNVTQVITFTDPRTGIFKSYPVNLGPIGKRERPPTGAVPTLTETRRTTPTKRITDPVELNQLQSQVQGVVMQLSQIPEFRAEGTGSFMGVPKTQVIERAIKRMTGREVRVRWSPQDQRFVVVAAFEPGQLLESETRRGPAPAEAEPGSLPEAEVEGK